MLTPSSLTRRLRHVPVALVSSGGLLVFSVCLAWVLAGGSAALGAGAGVGLVCCGYVVSHVCVALADAVNRTLVMPVGLAVYAGKLMVVGLVMAAIADSGWAGFPAMCVGVVAAVLVWTTAQAVWVWRARIPYVEIVPS